MEVFVFVFLRQGFSVALEAVLELALIDQAGLKITEICLPLPPSAGTKGVHHHLPVYLCHFFNTFIFLLCV